METAFGKAMMKTIAGNPQEFRMGIAGESLFPMACKEFMDTREEENRLLDSIALPDEGGAVLDFGCGAGRHLRRIRMKNPGVLCCGLEICDLLRNYCSDTISAPAEFATKFEDLSVREFDLIMLVGTGLGVLGTEERAVKNLQRLVASLKPGGHVLIETGLPRSFGSGYVAEEFVIEFEGLADPPFIWGYADKNWIRTALEGFGCRVRFEASNAPGGECFFAIGEKSE